MNKEETKWMPWLQQHMTEDEIIGLELKTFELFPHKSKVEKLPPLFKVINPNDRLVYYYNVLDVVKDSSQQKEIFDSIATGIGEKEWSNLLAAKARM